MRLALLRALNAERAARRSCLVVTPLDGGEQVLLRADLLSSDPMKRELFARLRDGKSGMMATGGRRIFVDVHLPPPRLIIVGAVHIAQFLAPMARLAGFDVFIVDPRSAFASEERFPDARLLAQWPDEALPALGLDAFTALAALTHDPKIDDLALRLALDADCFFIGALGSRTSHERRVERLLASGVDAEKIARLRAPIGLDIGAVTPAEIAVSILGEIVLTMGKKPLRNETRESRREFARV